MVVAYLAKNTGDVPNSVGLSSDHLMRSTGFNVGNVAFWHAVSLFIDEPLHLVTWNTPPEEIPSDVKAFVIPAANFLNETVNLDALNSIIRKLDNPCVLVGIGAQSENENRPPQLPLSVIQFINEISNRSPFIGARGDFSAEILRKHGAKNVEVLGCPSILINPKKNLGEVLEKKFINIDIERVAVHAACLKNNLSSVETELVRLVQFTQGSNYFIQRPQEFIKILFREELNDDEQKYVERASRILNFDSSTELQNFLRQRGLVPGGVSMWLQILRHYSCAIGTRIHGTILPLQAEIPAMCISHDTRTRELARSLLIPSISGKEFIQDRYRLKSLYKSLAPNGVEFDENRRTIAQKYVELFNKLGICVSSHLMKLAN